jgi:hypothetical protein
VTKQPERVPAPKAWWDNATDPATAELDSTIAALDRAIAKRRSDKCLQPPTKQRWRSPRPPRRWWL